MKPLPDKLQAENIVLLEMRWTKQDAAEQANLFGRMVQMALTAIRSERVRSANAARDYALLNLTRGGVGSIKLDELRDAIMKEPGSEGPGPSFSRTDRPKDTRSPRERRGG